MSHVTDLAKAEADQVEAEAAAAAEAEGATPPATDPETEAQAVGEKQLKALGREIEKYQAGLKRVMGDDFDGLHDCPLCSDQVPGHVFEVATPLDLLEEDEETKRCPRCNGKGRLKTGADGDYVETGSRMCGQCAGQGFVPRVQNVPIQQAMENGGVPPGYMPATADQMPTIDQWGRPITHIHFGIPPASIGA